MARIAGVDLPRDKRIEIGLTYIYGIGRESANQILEATKINPDTRVKDLDENDVATLRNLKDEPKNWTPYAVPLLAITTVEAKQGVYRPSIPVCVLIDRNNE